jgi:hypothetical protein
LSCLIGFAGGKLAMGKRVVTEDDFIVDDSDEEYDTASSTGGEDSGSEEIASPHDPELGDSWVDWADGEDVDGKLRSVVNGKGAHGRNPSAGFVLIKVICIACWRGEGAISAVICQPYIDISWFSPVLQRKNGTCCNLW